MVRSKRQGVSEGRLAPCPPSPNCVCSQVDPGDLRHYIEPFSIPEGVDSPIDRLAAIIQGMSRTQIVTHGSDYLHAEFKSRLVGFVDDVEFYAPPESSVVHVRSASRVGYSDFGVNRKRTEALRKAFSASRSRS